MTHHPRWPMFRPLRNRVSTSRSAISRSFRRRLDFQGEADYWANAIEDWTKTQSYKEYIAKNNLFPQFKRGDAFVAYLQADASDA